MEGLLGKMKAITTNDPPFSWYHLIDEHSVIWNGMSLWPAWISSPDLVHCQLLAHSQPTTFEGHREGKRKGLDDVQVLLIKSPKIGLLSTLL